MILRLSLLFILLALDSFATSVLIAKESLKYEELITSEKVKIMNIQSMKKSCIPVKYNELKRNKYLTTHYINKGSVICKRDIKQYKDNGVVFNFGSIQIEKKGKIIFENDKLLRIKKPDGTIEKIYKDGRLK